jgi:hypothetical protein
MMARQVDVRKLKDFAFREIPKDNMLRELLLSERDERARHDAASLGII